MGVKNNFYDYYVVSVYIWTKEDIVFKFHDQINKKIIVQN